MDAENGKKSKLEGPNPVTVMPASRFAFLGFIVRESVIIFHHLCLCCSACLLIFYLLYMIFGHIFFGILVVISLLALIYNYQDNLLYHPYTPPDSRLFVESPARFGLPYENLFLHTRDGIDIHAYLIKQPSPHSNNAFTLVFLHGNAGNIGHRLQNAQSLYTSCVVNILLLEYRGYGRSKGKPSEEGLLMDSKAAIEYIFSRPDLNHSKVIIFGRSLGGAVAISSAAAMTSVNSLGGQIAGLIIENTFTSILDVSKAIFKLPIFDYWPAVFVKNKFASIDAIQNIRVPTLFISGLQDELVPPDMMRQLFERSKSVLKRLFLIPNGNHNESWRCHGYFEQIAHFLQEIEDLRKGKYLQPAKILSVS